MNRGLDGLLIKSALGIGKATLSAAGLTAARAFTLPDAAGTLALLSDVASRNPIINSDMRVAQRGTSFAAIATATYSLDQWQYHKVGTAVHTASQQTDVPTLAQAGVLLTNSLRLALTTADTSIAAGDYVFIMQLIEGFNFAPLAQRALILSFWVKAGIAGTYCVSLRNSANDRSYVKEYTINATDTWEYKTLIFPASPSAGTWDYGTGIGLQIGFALAGGSTFQTTAESWQTGNFLATSNQVNGVNTGAGNFQLTAVQIEAGSLAPPFAVRSYGDELALCQRYYQLTNVSARFFAAAGSYYGQAPISYAVAMRATPTGTITAGTRANLLAGTPSVALSTDAGRFEIASNAAGDTYALADVIKLTAEL